MKKLIILFFIGITFYSCKSENDRLITKNRIGVIKLGDSYERLLKIEGISKQITNLSNKTYTNNNKIRIGFFDLENIVYAQKQANTESKNINLIICESANYETDNGLKVGMSIQELRKIYPSKSFDLKGGIDSRTGYFCPNNFIDYNSFNIPLSHLCLKLVKQENNDTIVSKIIIESY